MAPREALMGAEIVPPRTEAELLRETKAEPVEEKLAPREALPAPFEIEAVWEPGAEALPSPTAAPPVALGERVPPAAAMGLPLFAGEPLPLPAGALAVGAPPLADAPFVLPLGAALAPVEAEDMVDAEGGTGEALSRAD